MKITRSALRRLINEVIAETRTKPFIPGPKGQKFMDTIKRKFIDAPYGSKADLTQGSSLASGVEYEGPDYTRDVINYNMGALDNRVYMPDFQRLVLKSVSNILDPIVLDRLRVSLSSFKTISNAQQLLNNKASYDPNEKSEQEIHEAMLDEFANELFYRNGYMQQVLDNISNESKKGLYRFSSDIPPEFQIGKYRGSQTTSSDPEEMEDFVRSLLAVDDSVHGLQGIVKDIFKQKFRERYISSVKYAEQLRKQDFQGRLM